MSQPGSRCFQPRRALWTARAAVCIALTACGGGGVADKPVGPVPPVDTTKPTPPGTVQRATLAVTVSFDPADAGIASAAGVTPAGITVRIQRAGTTEPVRTAVTGADGVARFTELLEGGYTVNADRPLSSAEIARLPEKDQEAAVFAGGTGVVVTPPQGQTSVQLVANQRGSLVISEVFYFSAEVGRPAYGLGSYAEVYNNADTTVYLDGVLLFRTANTMHEEYDPGSCAWSESLRLDSLGIWADQIFSFPGSGREYPIRPGEAKVIAMDAMNHAAASPNTGQVDLSNAHFEQHGSDADIDNPFVPDMVRVFAGTGFLGRGYAIAALNAYGLALPSAQPRLVDGAVQYTQSFKTDVKRIPRDAVLDVMGLDMPPAERARLRVLTGAYLRCEPWLSPAFERAPAQLADSRVRKAIARRSLGRSVLGHEILQRTRTSARDFVLAEPLRRSLLK
jgi:hypothetical protein